MFAGSIKDKVVEKPNFMLFPRHMLTLSIWEALSQVHPRLTVWGRELSQLRTQGVLFLTTRDGCHSLLKNIFDTFECDTPVHSKRWQNKLHTALTFLPDQ